MGRASGPKARPMKAEWVTSNKKQCKEDNVPFFFKQWVGWEPDRIKRQEKEEV